MKEVSYQLLMNETKEDMIPVKLPMGHAMTLYAIKTDRFKTGMLSASMVKACDAVRSPQSTFLLSVLKRGTQQYPSAAKLNERLDYLYASSLSTRNYRYGDGQVIGFCTEFLDSRYLGEHVDCDIAEGCIQLMAELMFRPLCDEDGLLSAKHVESERKVLQDMILSCKNQPSVYAQARFAEVMFVGEPCGIPLYGTEAQVEQTTRADLAQVRGLWLDTAPLDFFYIGPEEPERIKALLEKNFTTFAPTYPSVYRAADVIRRAESVRRVTEDRDVSQGKLNLGYRTDCTIMDEGFPAMALANELFGASPVAKLFMQVREKLGLCYSIGSSFDIYKGVMRVSCGIDPDKYSLVCEKIAEEWDKVRRGAFTEEEWQAARRSLDNSYRTIWDSPSALEGFYYGRMLCGVGDTVEDCRRRFASVTREAVMEAASRVTLDTVYFLRGTKEVEGDDEDCDEGEE